jgi:hypothetical protein
MCAWEMLGRAKLERELIEAERPCCLRIWKSFYKGTRMSTALIATNTKTKLALIDQTIRDAQTEIATIETCGGKVFGHEAVVVTRGQVIESNFSRHWIEIEKKIHRKGRLSVILRAARKLRGFLRVESVTEYTEEQYLRVFGSGSENGAVQWRAAQREPSDRPWLQEAFRI